jgi:tripartite-type tricarboxylate transporter receptor subunit TctC
MKLTRALALAAALAVGAADDCVAQTYPTRPVRVVVPLQQ